MAIAEFLSDPAVRPAVVAELRRLAEVATKCGGRAELCGMYKLAASNWMVAAQRSRAANALAKGADFDPRDRRHVEQACVGARERMRELVGPLSYLDGAWKAAA